MRVSKPPKRHSLGGISRVRKAKTGFGSQEVATGHAARKDPRDLACSVARYTRDGPGYRKFFLNKGSVNEPRLNHAKVIATRRSTVSDRVAGDSSIEDEFRSSQSMVNY